MDRAATLGHLALYYLPGDMAPARRLFERLGCTLVENGPDPGHDGFCTVLLDRDTGNYADNLVFLALASPAQLAVEEAVQRRGARATTPRSRRSRSCAAAAGGRLSHRHPLRHPRIARSRPARDRGGRTRGWAAARPGRPYQVPPRRGLDPDVDARMDASPTFTGDEPEAFADHWIQCFVKTDVFAYGIIAFGQTVDSTSCSNPSSPPHPASAPAADPTPTNRRRSRTTTGAL